MKFKELSLNPPIRGSIETMKKVNLNEYAGLNPHIRGSIVSIDALKDSAATGLNPPIRGSIGRRRNKNGKQGLPSQSPYKGFNSDL